MKRLLPILAAFLLLLPLSSAVAQEQQKGDITGQIVTRLGGKPIPGAKVTIWDSLGRSMTSDSNGSFNFKELPYGVYRITVEAPDYVTTEASVRVNTATRDMNVIRMADDMQRNELDAANYAEFDFFGGDAQPVPVVLSSSGDVFSDVAGYKFGALRFRTRGYDTGLQDVYMNGILLNDAMNGYSPWSVWSGLNEATRNQEAYSGLAMTDFGIGGVNGITNIDSRASALRQGFRASVVHANAQYALRLMATYASGMQDNGWAYAASVSLRYGPNFYVDGVYYNAWGYYLSAEKQFNPLHRLSFTFMGVPTKRGAQMGATDEAYERVDDYFYNPNVGYQDGKMRNARVRNYHEPLAFVNYDFDISDQTKFSAAASFRFGKNGYSALDWYKGRDPKPDYYRNLPSYWKMTDNSDNWDLPKYYMLYETFWPDNTHKTKEVDWDWMYNVNYNQNNWDPTGYGKGRSIYIVSERHTDQLDFNLNTNISHEFNQFMRLNGGLAMRANRTEYYTLVKDLLGGEYWLNVDNFADRDLGPSGANGDINIGTINNMRDDNLVVKEGDKYGYDYYGYSQNFRLWAAFNYSKGQWDASVAGEAGYATFWRYGLYQKGLFPDNSYGKSDNPQFFTYTAKANGAYKISGRHQISAAATYMEKAPYFQDAFASARTRNEIVGNLVTEKIFAGELSYLMRMPWMTLKLTGYYSTIKDQTKLISYYDDVQRSFTNFAMSGMDQRHMGIELGFDIPLYRGLSLAGAVNYGDYVYTSDPRFKQTIDNSAVQTADNVKVFYNGLYVENTPQLAANLTLKYRTENYWFFELDASYFDRYYLSMNPNRRSESMLNLVRHNSEGLGWSDSQIEEKVNSFMRQEKFDPSIVVNASIGKNWQIQRKYNIGFSLQLKNILGALDYFGVDYKYNHIRTGGFEQMRFSRDLAGSYHDAGNPNPNTDELYYDYTPFDSKYFYLYGFNWYLNVYFRF